MTAIRYGSFRLLEINYEPLTDRNVCTYASPHRNNYVDSCRVPYPKEAWHKIGGPHKTDRIQARMVKRILCNHSSSSARSPSLSRSAARACLRPSPLHRFVGSLIWCHSKPLHILLSTGSRAIPTPNTIAALEASHSDPHQRSLTFQVGFRFSLDQFHKTNHNLMLFPTGLSTNLRIRYQGPADNQYPENEYELIEWHYTIEAIHRPPVGPTSFSGRGINRNLNDICLLKVQNQSIGNFSCIRSVSSRKILSVFEVPNFTSRSNRT